MTPLHLACAGLAGLGAGFINAIAGGGTLLSFPVLTALGMPAVAANVTNTVALCPGFLGASAAQREDLRGQRRRLWLFLPVGVVGGMAGGLLLLNSNEHLFRLLIPYFILLASALLAVQNPLRGWLVRRGRLVASGQGSDLRPMLPVGMAAIYGGYFGAGLSVILLAVLGLLLDDTLIRLNALKQTIALSANLAAAVVFVFSGRVVWPVAAIMAVGALSGGALGGRLATSISPRVLRVGVVTIGVIVAIIYFIK